jgi:tripeptidyl-peptidase I
MTQFPFGLLLTLFLSVPGHAQTNVHTTNTHVFKESIPQLTSRMDILKQSRMSSDYNHKVIFVIKQKNMEQLTRFLHVVSDPSSDIYGQHMSRAAVANLTSNPQGRETVLEYLHATGATVVAETLSGEYITATAPVTVWEEMFKCEFYMFHQTQENDIIRKVVRTESYSLPAVLKNHVDSVFNTVEMPHEIDIKGRLGRTIEEKFNLQDVSYTTPPKLRTAYNMGTSKGSASSTQGIYSFSNRYYSPNDLSRFQTKYGLDLQNVSTVIGGHESSSTCSQLPSSCVTANLDIQYIIAASPVSPTTFFSTDLKYFSDWLVLVANTAKPALVYSIGYGIEESFVTDAERDAFEIQAIKLGAMGVSIVAGSGDDGAVSRMVRTGGTCRYAPLFPASSPYVTAVGATMVSLGL